MLPASTMATVVLHGQAAANVRSGEYQLAAAVEGRIERDRLSRSARRWCAAPDRCRTDRR